MKKEELEQKIDGILRCKADAEVVHSQEDDLHLELINEFCPDWVKEELRRLTDADFPRWCA